MTSPPPDDKPSFSQLVEPAIKDALAPKKPVKKRLPRRKKRPAPPLPEGVDFSKCGPAMQALHSDRHRYAVRHYVLAPNQGKAAACRNAGLTVNCRDADIATRMAWNFFSEAKTIAAVAEEAKTLLRISHPKAVHSLLAIATNVDKNPMASLKAAQLVLDRTDPVAFNVDHHHTHEHTHDISPAAREEVLRNIRAIAKQAGVVLKSLPPTLDLTPEARDDDAD